MPLLLFVWKGNLGNCLMLLFCIEVKLRKLPYASFVICGIVCRFLCFFAKWGYRVSFSVYSNYRIEGRVEIPKIDIILSV
jgi:hypothetical protein